MFGEMRKLTTLNYGFVLGEIEVLYRIIENSSIRRRVTVS